MTMTIGFHCEHCGKEIRAPKDTGGRRGKCPYCHGSVFIPSPGPPGDALSLVPLDAEEERERRQVIQESLEAERILGAEATRVETAPRVSQMDTADVTSEDLHHLVVNYCLDTFAGNLERAETHVVKLNQHSGPNSQAVTDFLTGEAVEPALAEIPPKVLKGLLKSLNDRVG